MLAVRFAAVCRRLLCTGDTKQAKAEAKGRGNLENFVVEVEIESKMADVGSDVIRINKGSGKK